MTTNPRQNIEEAVASGDLQKLLEISGMLHGHFCPFSALGVKAAARAVRELKAHSDGMEKVLAVVETNNCFSDGVQIVTGCTFGNNGLVYRDYGKTAFTLAQRSGDGIRIALQPGRNFLEEHAPETARLHQKVVVERRGTDAEQAKLKKAWVDVSRQVLTIPDEELFTIRRVKMEIPAYARIFASVPCSLCGENIMEPRARLKDGRPVCLGCADHEYYQLDGNGITTVRR